VRLANGELAASRHECDMRWQEHYCSVTGGKVVKLCDNKQRANDSFTHYVGFKTTPTATLHANQLLPSNKGVGPDGLPAEVPKAGGSALAVKQCDIQNRAGEYGEWPHQWKSGRCISCHKGKGPIDVCDEHRGLLLADHASKSFVGDIKGKLDRCYSANISKNQYGGVPGRGADFAHHLIRSLHARARQLGWLVFTVFVDFSKAFDKLPRELVMRWPRSAPIDRDGRIQYLINMGVARDAAVRIHDYLQEHGCLLRQWNADESCVEMLNSLHDGSWFSIGELDSVIEYGLGGRQGCKVGTTIFNAAYDVPLQLLRTTLHSRGIALALHESPEAFYTAEDTCRRRLCSKRPPAGNVTVLDAAFIDDEFLVIMSPNNDVLACSIKVLVDEPAVPFAACGLDINWKPGKTEAMLQARGRGARALLESFSHPDGRYMPVPDVHGTGAPQRYVKTLQAAYMRVLRRIYGQVANGRTADSDLFKSEENAATKCGLPTPSSPLALLSQARCSAPLCSDCRVAFPPCWEQTSLVPTDA